MNKNVRNDVLGLVYRSVSESVGGSVWCSVQNFGRGSVRRSVCDPVWRSVFQEIYEQKRAK